MTTSPHCYEVQGYKFVKLNVPLRFKAQHPELVFTVIKSPGSRPWIFPSFKSPGSRPWIFPSFKSPGSRPWISSPIFHAIHKHQAKISRFFIRRIFFMLFVWFKKFIPRSGLLYRFLPRFYF